MGVVVSFFLLPESTRKIFAKNDNYQMDLHWIQKDLWAIKKSKRI